LLIFIFYQWTLKDSWLSTLLSVVTFLAVSAGILLPSFRTLTFARRDSTYSLYHHGSQQLARNGPLYAQYRVERYWFFVPLSVAFVLRAMFIAFAKSSGVAQIALLLVIELGLVIAHFILKPAKTKGSHVFTSYLAMTRLVCTGLMIAFVQQLRVKPIPRVAIGAVIVVIWSVSVIFMVGNIAYNIVISLLSTWRGEKEDKSILDSPAGSEGSMLEKGIQEKDGSVSMRSNLEASNASRGARSEINLNDDDMYSIAEVARARPVNPTPEQSVHVEPYLLTSFPVSPTASTVTTMDPPSLYSRDSGTMTVGSLLPRRWSFTMSQPGSPAVSSSGHQQRSSLTPSPLPPPSPSESSSHNHSSPTLSRNTSARIQQHQLRHEDIEEEADISFTSSSTLRPPQ